METHLIPTEYGMILSAFTHAQTLRGAAKLLNIDASGLVRKVQKMSDEFGLLQKAGNKWIMTEKGLKLNRWYDESVARQKFILDEMPVVRIASFSWFSEQSLIPNITSLKERFKTRYTWSFKTISANLEQELVNNRSDFVVTGHAPNDPQIAYKKLFIKDWAVIVPASWNKQIKGLRGAQLEAYLSSKPFIRISVMNPEQVFPFTLNTFSDVTIDGVIGIRTAVANGLGWSAVPAMSVRELIEQKKVIKVEVPVIIKDEVSLWWLRSRKDLGALTRHISQWLSELQ